MESLEATIEGSQCPSTTFLNDDYTKAIAFERALISIPAKCFEKEKGAHYTSAQQAKVSGLVLALPDLFMQRGRWEGHQRRRSQRQQQQQQQVPTVPSTSTSSAALGVAPTAAAPVTIAASALDRGAATDVALDTSSQPRFNTPLTIRTSATPGPSGRPTVSTSRQVSETVDHDSALRQARIGKKRATSSEDIGTGSKRARQDVEKYMYTYVLLNGIAA
jgi:hypothetical protein